MTPVLETARLRLRRHQLRDFDAYAAMWAEPDVVRYIGGVPLTREQAWARFIGQAGLWHHLGFGFFAIEEKATGALLGEAGVQEMRRPIEPSIEGTLETGWGLVPSAHRRGFATEAVHAVLEWAAASLDVRRATAIIDPANAPSLRLADKLGFLPFAETTFRGSPVVLLGRDLHRSPGAS